MRFSVILACHNRKALTLNAIRMAQASADAASVEVRFIVYDDGSADGTAEALAVLPSQIEVLTGDGSAYWARGMAEAEAAALSTVSSLQDEFLVWLNDDVQLDQDSFVRLKALLETSPGAIVAGAMRDLGGQTVTYSGLNRVGAHPLSFARVVPGDEVRPVDTFNGNLVVVPMDVALALGGIDGGFSHAFADIDYGLRAVRLGIPVLLAQGTYGVCPANPARPARIGDEWRTFLGPKGGGNFSSLRRILRKSHGRSWLVFIGGTYILWWLRRAVALVRGAGRQI